jgi:hypothetical protein
MLSLIAAAAAFDTIWLSSLDLTKATQGWGTPHADQSVEGHPITLHGRVFAHGYGTHSPGRLVIRLRGQALAFHAKVGVDDEVPVGRGSVEFEVVGGGGKILWRSGIMRRFDEPKAADVDISGQDRITLVVTTGGDGFDYDHADWANARIDFSGARPDTAVMESRTLEIAPESRAATPQIAGPTVIGSFPASPFVWRLPVTGEGPFRFRALSGLPKGTALDSGTGILSGTTPPAGEYSVRLEVRTAKGRTEETLKIASGRIIAATPPMGWNSYDGFGDSVTEDEMMANARFVAEHLQPFGWDTVVVDYRWYDPGAHNNDPNSRAGVKLEMDKFGRLLPPPNRFPSAVDGNGFRKLAGRLHAMGLRFGIHIMRGIPRQAVAANCPIEGSVYHAADAADPNDKCGWCPDMFGVRGGTPAGQAYYDSIFRLYAQWGVDFVKMDDTSAPYHTDEISAVRRAIDRCGRSIVYSLSPGETPIEDARHVSEHANMWRASGDFWDTWGSLDHAFDLAAKWQGYGGPGHWPDQDMLPLGHLSVGGRSVGPDRQSRFIKNEQITLISLWCLLPSPLMLGGNAADYDSWTQTLLTNREVLALNQDMSPPARRESKTGDFEAWSRHLANGDLAVGLFNRGETEAVIPLPAFDRPYRRLRDLWRRKYVPAAGEPRFTVPPHGAILLRLSR